MSVVAGMFGSIAIMVDVTGALLVATLLLRRLSSARFLGVALGRRLRRVSIVTVVATVTGGVTHNVAKRRVDRRVELARFLVPGREVFIVPTIVYFVSVNVGL